MKKSKKYLIGLTLIVAVLFVVPLLIPVRAYLNQAERVATEKIGVPVSIGSGRLQFLPTPRVIANDITVGEKQQIRLESLSVVPVIGSLLTDTKIVNIEITRPIIQKAALDIVAAISNQPDKPSDTSSPVRVAHIVIHELRLAWPEISLPALNLNATLKEQNALEALTLETVDSTLKATVTPNHRGHLILVNAEKWVLPAGIPALIDKATIEMHLHDQQLDIPKINVALYHGNLSGSAALFWSKGWKTSGKLEVNQVSVKELARMVSPSLYLSGTLFGKATFSSAAKEASTLMDHLNAEFRFHVNNGVLHGVDLVKVASLLTKQTTGGETQFDEFAAVLSVKDKHYALRDIKMRSGLLAASGQVKVKPDKSLDGLVAVELKKGVSLATVPLEVSGTVDQPSVLPTKAAMAGAVAGTAILGPGVGTSLGIAAGGAVDKIKGLFQSEK